MIGLVRDRYVARQDGDGIWGIGDTLTGDWTNVYPPDTVFDATIMEGEAGGIPCGDSYAWAMARCTKDLAAIMSECVRNQEFPKNDKDKLYIDSMEQTIRDLQRWYGSGLTIKFDQSIEMVVNGDTVYEAQYIVSIPWWPIPADLKQWERCWNRVWGCGSLRKVHIGLTTTRHSFYIILFRSKVVEHQSPFKGI